MTLQDAAHLPRLRPAGVLYTAKTRELPLLADFAHELTARGWRVGGLVQETLRGPDGYKRAIVATDLGTGAEITLATYKGDRSKESECGFDTAALAEATRAVRRAVETRADIIVIEKFGRRETEGSGLFDEILAAMAEGIPTVTLVSADALEEWNRLTGDLGVLLAAEPSGLWRWWGAHRLYRDLEQGVEDQTAARVLIGFNWVLVEGPHGCGLAQTPDRGSAACRGIADGSGLAGRSLRELAAMVHSWDPVKAAVGLAAINAFYNRFDLDVPDGNGLETFAAADEPVSVVGRFASLTKHIKNPLVFESDPADGEYPQAAASWLLPDSERVIVTASTLVNHSLPGILGSCPDAQVALVGPSTPLSPRLHSYGVDTLAGMIVEDVEGAVRAISEGGSLKALKRCARMATLNA
ncbi:MAG: DUF2478 domain-containing protein [Rhodospirillales bacterium]|jgi:uncharacterized protein|nr:DUF2478 domain-containing protein [Rhodospirillales bacterium]